MKYILISILMLTLTSCQPEQHVIEKMGHVYIWKINEGYYHDPMCPGDHEKKVSHKFPKWVQEKHDKGC